MFFNERRPSMEDNLRWMTTFNGTQPLKEDTLRWKTTFDGRQLLIERFRYSALPSTAVAVIFFYCTATKKLKFTAWSEVNQMFGFGEIAFPNCDWWLIEYLFEANCEWDGYMRKTDFLGVGLEIVKAGCDQMEDVRAAFKVFDHNNDGSISREELREAMVNLGTRCTDE